MRRLVHDGTITFVNTETQMREESLGVIPRPIRLPNGYRHSPGESCEQDRALDLCARDGAGVGEATQSAPTDREGKPVASFINIRTHLLERLGHTPHPAPAPLCGAGQRR